jgi:hypothetical protein
VSTKPVGSWKDLFYQRVRWASKTKDYKSTFGKILGLFVLFGNLSMIIFALGFGFWTFNLGILGFGLLILKLLVDFKLIHKTQHFLKAKTKYIFLSSILYPFFSVSVAFYTLFGKYEWKGRKFS